MKPVLVVTVLALLLAGCAAPSEAPGALRQADGDIRPEVAPPIFLPPIELGVQDLGAEPSVAVSPEGMVYVTTPLALWRSDDQGITFQAVGDETECQTPACTTRHSGMEGGGDATLAAGPGGLLYWAGLQPNSDHPTVPVQVSRDFGASWSEPFDVAERNWSDRQWISRDDDGAVHVAWRDSGNVNDTECLTPIFCTESPLAEPRPSGLFVRGSLDGGATWGPRVRVTDDTLSGPVATDPSSSMLYLPNVADGVAVARSADGGLTWENVQVRPGVPNLGTFIFPVAAVDDAGIVYVVWSQGERYVGVDETTTFALDRAHARPQVFLSHSLDHGMTWSEPIPLSPAGVPSVFPWIAAGAQGRVVVAWYEAVAPVPSDRTPNLWNVAVAMGTTADQDAPTFVKAFANPEPHHMGSICTSGLFCSLTAGDRSLLDFFEVRLLPDGSPVLAYAADADVRLGTVKVYATRMTEGTRLR